MELNILSAGIILEEKVWIGDEVKAARCGSGLRAIQSDSIVLGEGASPG